MKILIITMSDRASKGEYEDESGPLAEKMFSDFLTTHDVLHETSRIILSDEEELLRKEVLSFQGQVDVICINGGTGLGPRDITPEVIQPLLTKEIPGIMELIRVKYGMKFPNALLSRGVAGLIGSTLVYTLPGNPKAVAEYLNEILPTLLHSFKMIHGAGH